MENLHLCSDLASIYIKTPAGRTRRLATNIEEISTSRAILQLERPVPQGTRLRLACSNCNASCDRRAVVRNCKLRKGIGYDCDVVFEEGSEWNPEQCKPAHLLDLRDLAERPAGAQ